MKKKYYDVHFLNTTKKSRLGFLTQKGYSDFKDLRHFQIPMPIILDSINVEIVITSDENPNVGDKCLVNYGTREDGVKLFELGTLNKIGVSGIHYFDDISQCYAMHEDRFYKIVASSLIDDPNQIDDKFIAEFISQYSDGNLIKIVSKENDLFVIEDSDCDNITIKEHISFFN